MLHVGRAEFFDISKSCNTSGPLDYTMIWNIMLNTMCIYIYMNQCIYIYIHLRDNIHMCIYIYRCGTLEMYKDVGDSLYHLGLGYSM